MLMAETGSMFPFGLFFIVRRLEIDQIIKGCDFPNEDDGTISV